MRRVVHLSSVHSASDPRIFFKQCRSLADAGYEVTLIIPHQRDEERNGVEIRAVPAPRGRAARMTRTVWQIYRAAVAAPAAVYHFHDPELIPVGLLLRLRGAKVIYDVHEDYVTAIRQKSYLPRPVRSVVAELLRMVEAAAGSIFDTVLAERYYRRRFPSGTLVLNYPLREALPSEGTPLPEAGDRIRLLYTGVVSEDRGALRHANLVNLCPDVEVHIVGRCDPELAARMRRIAGRNVGRLHLIGEGTLVDYAHILHAYRQGGWVAGLALFPLSPHYREKELTKFFEYMAAGIPIICSNFATWRALIEDSACGICVDPEDSQALLSAIRYLVRHPEAARKMGTRGRHAVATSYNWDHEARNLLSLYERVFSTTEQPKSRSGSQ